MNKGKPLLSWCFYSGLNQKTFLGGIDDDDDGRLPCLGTPPGEDSDNL